MKKLVELVPAALLLAAAILAPHTVAATPAPVVANIHGGGTAIMNPAGSDFGLAGTTAFGMGVKLRSDGTASGHFDCVDQFGSTFAGNFFGEVTSWSQNADGSVSFSGTAKVIAIADNPLTGPVASNMPFRVTIHQFGRAGVGHWTLETPNGAGGFFIICDETLTSGQIVLHD